MKKLVAEWVKKAEGDAGTAKREAKVKEAATNWDAVCFHAQQAVEKYLGKEKGDRFIFRFFLICHSINCDKSTSPHSPS